MRTSIQRLSIITLVVILFFPLMLKAQPPVGYYDSATGNGYEFKTSLHHIIKDHNTKLYSELWNFFAQADIDLYYEVDGTLLDIYSENPTKADPYTYVLINDQCGNYNREGDCYNREHLVPRSSFDDNPPMDSDVHHIFPTDGWVNNKRSNFPFGNVSNTTYSSMNGSKLGPNRSSGYNGTVFEVIDEFKGDVARALFYFATRYEDQIANWEHDMFNNTSHQVFEDWFLAVLLEWNEMDPVSDRERNRNNIAHEFQGNRNPFIDNQDWVNRIWNPSTAQNPVQRVHLIELFPNPNSAGVVHVRSSEPINETIVYNVNGAPVYIHNNNGGTQLTLDLKQLPQGCYFVCTISNSGSQMNKLMLN